MEREVKACPVELCEDITVKVPVTICAETHVGKIEIKCLGHTIERHDEDCDQDQHKHCTHFTVVQRIQVRIPLTFKSEADVGKEHTRFDMVECD
jgi:hypothetical protein